MTLKFILQSKKEHATIYIYLSIGKGKFYKRKTNETITPKYWNYQKGAVKNLTALNSETRQYLDQLTDKLNRLKSYIHTEIIQTPNSQINSDFLALKINEFYNGKQSEKMKFLGGFLEYFEAEYLPTQKTMHPKRKQRFFNLIKALKECYKKDLHRLPLTDFGAVELDRVKAFLIGKNLNNNTANDRIKLLKSMLKIATKKGLWIGNIEDFKTKNQATPTPYLTTNEIEQIKALDLINENLIKGREWLIIGCYTGQRISDLMQMKKEMITTINGKEFISLKQQKTKAKVLIPIHQEVRQILDKYGGNFPTFYGGSLCRATYLFNSDIKTLCHLAKIDRPQKGKIYDKEKRRFIQGEFPFYQVASSHICRRSFATNHYGKVPTPIIMSITGHKEETTFLEYIGVDDATLSGMIFDFWKQ